ncbi:MAG: hypothetical protein R2807_01820 [Chitinophagales bacterium]
MQKHIAHVMTVRIFYERRTEYIGCFPKKKLLQYGMALTILNLLPKEAATNEQPYFLTVISYQKKKNFERLIEAYQLLDENLRN